MSKNTLRVDFVGVNRVNSGVKGRVRVTHALRLFLQSRVIFTVFPNPPVLEYKQPTRIVHLWYVERKGNGINLQSTELADRVTHRAINLPFTTHVHICGQINVCH